MPLTEEEVPTIAVDVGTPRVGSVPLLVRVASHITVWTCILVPSIVVLAQGWTPLGDYAAIELRAYGTLSLHPALVGMFSTAGSGVGHTVFDPGPLSFWMLGPPVRIDPAHGLIWGSALLWGLVLSLAVEALWASGLWVGSALVALAVVDLLWAAPSVLENLAWNAYLPLPFLMMAVVAAFLVVRGLFGWWPVLVFTASVAAQTHLLYFIPAVGLMSVAPALGRLAGGRPDRLRWLAMGLGVALVCWIGPLVQGLGTHSNVTALAHGTGGAPRLGPGFGLSLLGDAVTTAVPIWLHHVPTGFYPEMAFAFGHSAVYGVVGLVVVLIAAGAGLLVGHRDLFAFAAVTLMTVVGLLVSYSIIPAANLPVVGYLLVALWALGWLIWLSAAWCICALCTTLLKATGVRVGRRFHKTRVSLRSHIGLSLVALLATGSSVAVAETTPGKAAFGTNWTPREAHDTTRIVTLVEHSVRRGKVNIAVRGSQADPVPSIAVAEGVGFELLLNGWHPGLPGINPAFTLLPPRPGSPEMSIEISRDTIEVKHAIVADR